MRFESNVKRWPGYIETEAFMRFPQLVAYEKALAQSRSLAESAGVATYFEAILPTCISLVTKWHIIGYTVDENGEPIKVADGTPLKPDFCNFPASAKLVSWLVGCVSDLYSATNESDPN